MLLLDLFCGESSDKNGCAVPDNLDNLGRWQFRNIDFHISVPIISGPSSQSTNGSNGIKPGEVQHTSIVNSTQGIKLGSSDFSLMLIIYSVFIEPVVNGRLEIDMVTEVTGSGGGHEELSLVGNRMEPVQLLVRSFVIFADQTEIGFKLLRIVA